jgi:hypothetical protein
LEIQLSNGYAEVDFVEKSPVFIDFGLKAAPGGPDHRSKTGRPTVYFLP